MGIDYTTSPKTFMELCDSVRGQVERSRELAMMGQKIPLSESVELTSESFLETLDRIEHLSEMAMENAQLFMQINDIFQWIFKFIGLDLDELYDSQDESEEDGD